MRQRESDVRNPGEPSPQRNTAYVHWLRFTDVSQQDSASPSCWRRLPLPGLMKVSHITTNQALLPYQQANYIMFMILLLVKVWSEALATQRANCGTENPISPADTTAPVLLSANNGVALHITRYDFYQHTSLLSYWPILCLSPNQ